MSAPVGRESRHHGRCLDRSGTFVLMRGIHHAKLMAIRNRDTVKRYALPIQVSELARKLYALMGVKWSGANLTIN